MPSSSPPSGDIFDMRKIRRLVELLTEHDLSEIDLQQGDQRIRVRRQLGVVTAAASPAAHSPAAPPNLPAGSTPPAASAAADEAHLTVVKSPMVGTFYATSSPESPPYVKVGDHVGPETVVCIVEAMKVFNEIPAGISGRIAAVLVENGEPVEFGQPMFKVDTRR